jgi:hypothetical protein
MTCLGIGVSFAALPDSGATSPDADLGDGSVQHKAGTQPH